MWKEWEVYNYIITYLINIFEGVVNLVNVNPNPFEQVLPKISSRRWILEQTKLSVSMSLHRNHSQGAIHMTNGKTLYNYIWRTGGSIMVHTCVRSPFARIIAVPRLFVGHEYLFEHP